MAPCEYVSLNMATASGFTESSILLRSVNNMLSANPFDFRYLASNAGSGSYTPAIRMSAARCAALRRNPETCPWFRPAMASRTGV